MAAFTPEFVISVGVPVAVPAGGVVFAYSKQKASFSVYCELCRGNIVVSNFVIKSYGS